MTAKKFTKDELVATTEKIKQLIIDLKEKQKELKEAEISYNKFPDPTLARGVTSKKVTVDLFDTEDIQIIDEITVWSGNDVYDSDNETIEETEE